MNVTNGYFLWKYLSEIKYLILQHLVSSIELNTQNSAANIEIDESFTAQSDTNLGRGNISTDKVDSDTDGSHTLTMLLSGDDLSHLSGPVTLDTILHHLESRYYLQSYQVSSAMEIMFQINVKLRRLLRKVA